MAQNIFLIGSLLLGLLALILIFASWMTSRKVTLSDSERSNSQNLLIAGMVFLVLGLIAGTIYAFKPTLGSKYTSPPTVPVLPTRV
jgi:hypothetical protein